MRNKTIYHVEGHVLGEYESTLNAMIDTWDSLLISKENFKKSIYEVGVPFAQRNKVTSWIVDTSNSEGLFKVEVQKFIDESVAPKFAEIGIQRFFIIPPKSAIAKLSATRVAEINNDQDGMQTITIESVNSAMNMIKGK